MNKTDLISAVSADTGLTKADAGRALDAAFAQIAGALAKGDAVQLIGFGTFGISARAERTGRNPSTGEAMTIKASKSAKFTAGKALKDALNGAA